MTKQWTLGDFYPIINRKIRRSFRNSVNFEFFSRWTIDFEWIDRRNYKAVGYKNKKGYKNNGRPFSSTLILSGSRDQTIRLWDSTTGEVRQTLQDSNEVFSAYFSNDGKIILSHSGEVVKVWEIATNSSLLNSLSQPDIPNHIQISLKQNDKSYNFINSLIISEDVTAFSCSKTIFLYPNSLSLKNSSALLEKNAIILNGASPDEVHLPVSENQKEEIPQKKD